MGPKEQEREMVTRIHKVKVSREGRLWTSEQWTCEGYRQPKVVLQRGSQEKKYPSHRLNPTGIQKAHCCDPHGWDTGFESRVRRSREQTRRSKWKLSNNPSLPTNLNYDQCILILTNNIKCSDLHILIYVSPLFSVSINNVVG